MGESPEFPEREESLGNIALLVTLESEERRLVGFLTLIGEGLLALYAIYCFIGRVRLSVGV